MIRYEIKLSEKSNNYLIALMKGLEKKELFRRIFKLFDKLGSKAAAHVVKTKLSGQVLKRRTAALAQSVVGRATYVASGLPGFRVGIFRGPALKYAAVQEYGATILPVRAKYLAMPVGEALTPAGVARWKSPRDFPGRLVFIPFRNSGVAVGALYDAASLKTAKLHGEMNWEAARKLWVLLKKAKIPARSYLLSGMREFLPQVASELVAFLRDLVKTAGVKLA